MDLNIKKCHSMIYSRSVKPLDYVYSISGTALEGLSRVEDLGITFDSQITFSSHNMATASKSLQIPGSIRFQKHFQKHFL